MKALRVLAKCTLAASSIAAVLSVATPAAAQARGWTPRTMGNRLGADIDIWPTDSGTTFSVGFIGQIELSNHAFLDLDFPWAYGSPGQDHFTLGNPTIGAHYATRLGQRASFYIGGTGSPPMHVDGKGAGDSGTAARAALARALDDLHRFLPQYVFLRAPFGFEMGFRPVFLRFEFTPVFWIPLPSDADEPELVFEHATEFEVLANIGVGGGGRFQAVFFPTADSDLYPGTRDRVQLAIEPYFVYEPEPRGFFARAGLLLAVDPPLGPPFEPNRVATLRATLGGKW